MSDVTIKILADIRQITKSLKTIDGRFKEFSDQSQSHVKKISDKINGTTGTIAKMGLTLQGVQQIFMGFQQVGRAMFGVAADFEMMQVRLENMYGSAQAGEAAFKSFVETAATTPFQVDQVVQAGSQLKAFGMEAKSATKVAADLAAYMGTDIVAASDAMGRAFAGGAGAADILRDKGLLNIIKTRQGIDDFKNISLEEFRKAMIDTFTDPDVGIAGATDKMANTLLGKLSMLGDAFIQLRLNIGKGMVPGIKGLVDGLTASVNWLSKNTPVVYALATAFTVYHGVLRGGTALEKLNIYWKKASTVATLAYTKGIRAATVASKTFKAALASTGIGLLVLALGEIIVHWKTVVAYTKLAAGWVKKFFTSQSDLLDEARNDIKKLKEAEAELTESQTDQVAAKQQATADMQKAQQDLEDYLHSARRVGLIEHQAYLEQKLADMQAETAEEKLAYEKLRDKIADIESQITKNRISELRKRSGEIKTTLQEALPFGTDDQLFDLEGKIKSELQRLDQQLALYDNPDVITLVPKDELETQRAMLMAMFDDLSSEKSKRMGGKSLISLDDEALMSQKAKMDQYLTSLKSQYLILLAQVRDGSISLSDLTVKETQSNLAQITALLNNIDEEIEQRDQERLDKTRARTEMVSDLIRGEGYTYDEIQDRIKAKAADTTAKLIMDSEYRESAITGIKEKYEFAKLALMQIVDGIKSLFHAKDKQRSAEKIVQEGTETATVAVKAGAEVTEEGAKIPFPLNLIAIPAGLAAVFAALKSIKGNASGIVKMAEGGLVNKPQLALIGEAVAQTGPELVMPQTTFTKYMDQKVLPEILANISTPLNDRQANNLKGVESRLDRVERAILSRPNPTADQIGEAITDSMSDLL